MSDARLLVIGGGLAGLVAGLRLRRARPEAEVLVVEAQPAPAREARTQRSNGFVCELGAFAFSDDELAPALDVLARPPKVVPARDGARSGWLFDGHERRAVEVAPPPRSFASGCEELAQALRRELGGALRLGRAVTALLPRAGGGFEVTLGGEAPTTLAVDEVALALRPTTAAPLLATFDPRLAALAEAAQRAQRALVFFGGLQRDCEDLTGYGVLAHPDAALDVTELIYCTNAFANRALADRFLLRAELAADELPADDDDVAALADARVREWTGTAAAFGFHKVHRFSVAAADGLAAECRARAADVVRNVPGLTSIQ